MNDISKAITNQFQWDFKTDSELKNPITKTNVYVADNIYII